MLPLCFHWQHAEAKKPINQKKKQQRRKRLKQLKMDVIPGLRVRFKPGDTDMIDAYELGYRFGTRLNSPKKEKKAALLYDYLDSSRLFKGTVRREDRSLMNVPFVTGDKDMDAKFVAEAAENGLVNLKGHRTVGGMRASLYNAMPYAGVEKLVTFMEDFEKANS